MPINKKTKKQIPGPINEALKEAFTYQQIYKGYEGAFKEAKEEALALIEDPKSEFECDLGKGFEHECGKVIAQAYPKKNIDKDVLLDLIDDGQVTIASILEAANFSVEKLKTALGERNFDKVVTIEDGKLGLTLRANAEFKAKVDETIDLKRPKKSKAKSASKKPAKSASKKKSAKSAPKSTSEDLDAILGE